MKFFISALLFTSPLVAAIDPTSGAQPVTKSQIAAFDRNGDGFDSDEIARLIESFPQLVKPPAPGELRKPVAPSKADIKDYGGEGPMTDRQIRNYTLAKTPFYGSEFDLDHDGALSLKESLAFSQLVEGKMSDRKVVATASDVLENLDARHISPTPETVEQAMKNLGYIDGEKAEALFGKLRIRESADVEISAIKDISDAKPATVAFTRDFEDDGKEVWEIKAAVLWPITAKRGFLNADTADFLPSVAWEKVDGTKKDANVVTGRIGFGQTWLKSADSLFPVQEVKVSGSYAYDIEHGSELAEISFDYLPIDFRKWLNSFKASGPLAIKLVVKPSVSFVHVFDEGSNEDLEDRDDSIFGGGTVGIAVRPNGGHFDRIEVSASYAYQSAVTGSPVKSDLFKANLSYKIDKFEHYTFEIEYQNGEVTLVKVPTDKIQLKLGVKY